MLAIGLKSHPHPKTEIEKIFTPINIKTKDIWTTNYPQNDLKKVNYTLDLLGNVTIFNWLWFLFKTREGYKFGNVRETISYVLKVNHEQSTLRYLGKPLYNIINKLDPGHFDNLKF